jgi:hypothetical protein
MLAIIGTVPDEEFKLYAGEVSLEGESLVLKERRIPVQRGTPALIASSLKILELFGKAPPFVYLAGDTGRGHGSKRLYEFLVNDLKNRAFQTLTFHYLLPDADWCNKILFTIDEMPIRPFLIADAGFMYAAKMSGNATSFDLFTPDAGELAFLADEEAPHPFYTRGFLLQEDDKVEELVQRAYEHDNASRYLLVKGRADYVVREGRIIETISEPIVEALEPIGGTGDTLTGILSALIECGYALETACITASKINRLAGKLTNPDPSTQIGDIIKYIPEAFKLI